MTAADATASSRERLVAAAAGLYRGAFAHRFARGKLARDPLFATLMRTGAIPDASCLIDLGCGQGLLAAWLHASRAAWVARDSTGAGGAGWPAAWPAAPKVGTYLGIDRSRADIARARRALPPFARVFKGDVRTLGATLLDRCDVVTLFDVLHYIDRPAQEALLAAVAAGLPPWGVIVMRVGDATAGRASRFGNAVDLVVGLFRGHQQWRLHRRSLDEWVDLLDRLGFDVELLDDRRADGPATRSADLLMRAFRKPAGPPGSPAPVR